MTDRCNGHPRPGGDAHFIGHVRCVHLPLGSSCKVALYIGLSVRYAAPLRLEADKVGPGVIVYLVVHGRGQPLKRLERDGMREHHAAGLQPSGHDGPHARHVFHGEAGRFDDVVGNLPYVHALVLGPVYLIDLRIQQQLQSIFDLDRGPSPV